MVYSVKWQMNKTDSEGVVILWAFFRLALRRKDGYIFQNIKQYDIKELMAGERDQVET